MNIFALEYVDHTHINVLVSIRNCFKQWSRVSKTKDADTVLDGCSSTIYFRTAIED